MSTMRTPYLFLHCLLLLLDGLFINLVDCKYIKRARKPRARVFNKMADYKLYFCFFNYLTTRDLSGFFMGKIQRTEVINL